MQNSICSLLRRGYMYYRNPMCTHLSSATPCQCTWGWASCHLELLLHSFFGSKHNWINRGTVNMEVCYDAVTLKYFSPVAMHTGRVFPLEV